MKKFDVSSLMQSDQNQEQFRYCSVCRVSIVDKNFVVEKAYKKEYLENDWVMVFELAVCDACRLQMNRDISSESKKNIQQFLHDKAQIIQENKTQVIEKLKQLQEKNQCFLTGKSIDDCQEFQVVLLHSPTMNLPSTPLFISDDAIEMYQALLSDHTKGFFDDFMDNLNGLPPEIEELFRSKKSLVLL